MQLVLTTGFYSIAPVTSLFVLASSVCWSLQCLISTLTQGAVVDTFLGSLVQSYCGGWVGGRCKQVTLVCVPSVSAILGLPLLTV